ncbi:GNAT family N-acetyltransferase [Sphingomonas sp.]|uniref:GNAT family N-acetyltransferase n=1 Tax=Sphingomonas sp. TaxID=28214 RepID=UPI003B3AB4D0
METIRTRRLLLRRATRADLDAVHTILGDPRAMTYWSTPPHRDRNQTRDWLAAMIATEPAEGDDFLVEHEGRVIGKAGLYRFPEIGFIFAPAYWGRGFAGEALRPIIRRAFAHGLPAIEADVDPRNIASLNLLRRLHFTESGRAQRTWCVGGVWCDSVYLRLSADTWAAASP